MIVGGGGEEEAVRGLTTANKSQLTGLCQGVALGGCQEGILAYMNERTHSTIHMSRLSYTDHPLSR